MERRTERAAAARRPGLLAGAALVLLAFGVRLINLPGVFREGMTLFGSADAWYHLRRIVYSVTNFPQTLGFDSYLNHPNGGISNWPQTFDWLLAAFARITVGPGDVLAIERVVSFAPPLLGAAAVGAVFWLGARVFSPAVGFFGALFLALLPGHVHFSKLGFVDHHVAVILLLLAAMIATAALVASPAGPHGAGRLRRACVVGVLLSAMPLLWPGALLHIGLFQLFFAAFLLSRERREDAAAWAGTLAATQGVAALLLLPFALRGTWDAFGTFSLIALSRFHPLWLGSAAVLFGVLAFLWRRSEVFEGRMARLGLAGGLGVAGVGLALLVPELRASVASGLGWFGTEQRADFQQFVAELQPLFVRGGRFAPAEAELALSRAVYLYPLAWGALALHAVRHGLGPGAGLVVLWGGVAGGLVLLQNRFLGFFSPVYALVLGWGAVELARFLRDRLQGRSAAVRAAVTLAALVGAGFLAAPSVPFYRGALGALLATATPPPAGFEAHQAQLIEIGRWMRAHTPPTPGFLEPGPRPEYGVLANWSDGHALRYAAERPMHQDNYLGHTAHGGPEIFEACEAYFGAATEAEALEVGRALETRYVLAGPAGSGHSLGYGLESVFVSMHRRLGSYGEHRAAGQVFRFPALRHHRLIRQWIPGGQPAAAQRLFERVAGARVEGSAAPDALVEARLMLRVGAGRFEYVQRDRADSSGRYALVLPYANEPFSPDVAAIGPWRIESGGLRSELRVSESAVQSGGRLEGPGFAEPSSG